MSDSRTRIEAAIAQIDEWVQPAGVAGCGIAVVHRGELVAERYAGEARPGVSVDPSTLFALASVTKPVSAAVAMAAVEGGLVGLDEPVARFLPGLATRADARAREAVTLRRLLSHTAGVDTDLPVEVRRALPDVPTAAELTAAHVGLALVAEPGTSVSYSNTGYAIAGALIEAVVAEPFWRFARHRVLTGPGLTDLVIDPAGADLDRTAVLADAAAAGRPTESYNSAWWRGLAMPWGGAYGTPRALAAVASSFLPGRESVLAITPATRRLMTTDQTRGRSGGVAIGRVFWPEAAWGLGWEIKGSKRRHWSGELTSPRTFCHFGQAGTLVWADPERDLAVAVFTNRSVTKIWSFMLSRWLRLSNAVVAAV